MRLFLSAKALRLHLAHYSRRLVTMSAQPAIVIPDGFTLHTENTSHILLPSTNEAFLNPIQEFNRDLSIACITTWSEELDRKKEAKWQLNREKRAKKAELGSDKKRLKGVSHIHPMIEREGYQYVLS